MVWLVFLGLSAAVIAWLLRPVLKSQPFDPAQDRNAYDRAIFRDQLAELDRDEERGAIARAEADAARNEISRRLIGVAKPAAVPAGTAGSAAAIAAAILVPVLALPLYLQAGRPGMPDVPLAQRLEKAAETGDFAALIAKVEAHLAKSPGDVEGWKVLAPAYRRMERWSDAANAYANILRLAPPLGETVSDYAEMLVYANEGLVSAEARRQFEAALRLEPGMPKARFFVGLALKQEGKRAEARDYFGKFLAESPADATWRSTLEAQIAEIDAMPETAEDQQAMIRGMVEGLEARLKEDGADLEGWLKLMRSQSVLNETDKAKDAYAAARDKFKDDAEALARIDGLARELNIR